MNEVTNGPKKCPKCGGEMDRGKDLRPDSLHYVGSVHFLKTDDQIGDKIFPFYCKSCGYIELYKERSWETKWDWETRKT